MVDTSCLCIIMSCRNKISQVGFNQMFMHCKIFHNTILHYSILHAHHCTVFTLSRRLGFAQAPRSNSTTSWWLLKLAMCSAVKPSCRVECNHTNWTLRHLWLHSCTANHESQWSFPLHADKHRRKVHYSFIECWTYHLSIARFTYTPLFSPHLVL